jgi:serine/threonine protein phosphatase PrpC
MVFALLYQRRGEWPIYPYRGDFMKGKSKDDNQAAGNVTLAYLQYAALRDQGRQKADNQDNTFALTCQLPSQIGGDAELPFGLFILADGVSGQRAGEYASAFATQKIAGEAIKHLLLPLLEEQEASAAGGAITDILIDAVSKANAALFALANPAEGASAPGSTIVVALVVGQRLYAAHVGDSRIYLHSKEGELRQLTTDHSMVQRLVEMGQLTAAEAQSSDQRSVLYRALGQQASVEVDTYSATLPDCTRLLLCSDGLWSMVEDRQIVSILQAQAHPSNAVAELVAAANQAGGEDNISAIVVALD